MVSYTDKSILIIGGTGTIGQKITKEILKENPKVIRIFSRDEYKQFIMDKEMPIEHKNKIRFLIGDVRDYDRVERAMENIDIVFNLAAMKHVPSCEYNPDEAVKTNIIGVENVIKASMKKNVECMVFTSSDKAINPTNAYGATKLLGEKLVQAAQFSKGISKTKFVAVRFGNVMGSRGSVIPLFKKQVLENKRITITDKDMSRFMMTQTQAARLTMKAVFDSKGGETFVLKMPVINLGDLAEVVIEETCSKFKQNYETVAIDEIGIRPGEKMYEELMTEEESRFCYDLGDMFAVIPTTFNFEDYEEYYKKHSKAKVGMYSSHDETILTKEEVKELLISENLI
ncbi:SDR family NAD(P)-dependent oxidoreductase [Clostridium grantii]|uniref:Polysaccharide biosynthesis protein n=1 Tax=Clostridium grantii DSM 8605 TaxID=1121316 RepID=A0A1M5W6H7_9CLOT|nr:SDR family NAD(P)-dependent oxidoreductase [Clostridium grantii]SHH83199.1 Polysaccharide biosynthesis protein [Clostridium grantii DSM 8605]